MDNFLQLVPMEADADESDSALVYGEEEEDLVAHGTDAHHALDEASAEDSAAQFFAPLTHFAPPVAPSDAASSATPAQGEAESMTPEQERERYLQKLMAMENAMRAAQSCLQKRLDAVHRIRAIPDPAEQLAEYLPLLMEQRRDYEAEELTSGSYHEEDDAGTTNAEVAAELLECARQMSDARDAEVALLAAFVFLSDAPSNSRKRSPSSIVPAVAALLDESAGGMLDHHPF